MDTTTGNLLFVNICCVGVNTIGVSVSAVIAYMCPSVIVNVVDIDPDKVTQWNTRQILFREPELETLLQKCENRNLVFSTNTEETIKRSDIIFVSLNSPGYKFWEKKTLDLKEIDETARFIASASETSKIIVLKNTVPVGSADAMKKILNANKAKNVDFEVISMPEFFTTGNAVHSLLHPERVLIGSEMTREGKAAAGVLIAIYTQWVPREYVITMSTWSAELTKLVQSALFAQRASSVNSLSVLCETVGADISDVAYMISKTSAVGDGFTSVFQPSFCLTNPNLINDLMCLIYIYEKCGFTEAADYWKQVLILNTYVKNRFRRKILSHYFNTLANKKLTVFGVTYLNNGDCTNNPAIELILELLEEKASVSLYDPQRDKRQLLEELEDTETLERLEEVNICDDAYQACWKSDAIIVCTNSEEFKTLNYSKIFSDMRQPAVIFDGMNFLSHRELLKIGFVIKTIGKSFPTNV